MGLSAAAVDGALLGFGKKHSCGSRHAVGNSAHTWLNCVQTLANAEDSTLEHAFHAVAGAGEGHGCAIGVPKHDFWPRFPGNHAFHNPKETFSIVLLGSPFR